MLSVTIDVDWAPDPVIEYTLDLLDDHGVTATLFSTHDDGVSAGRHERALHPNFSVDGAPDDVLDDLWDIYPDADGIRSHRLEISTPLRTEYAADVRYESNYIAFGAEGLAPHWHHGEVAQFPIYFMDGMWLRRGAAALDPDAELARSGLQVYCFHPVHVYLNTASIEQYEAAKEVYHRPEKLREHRQSGRGVEDLFVDLLGAIERSDREPEPLGTLVDRFADENPYGDCRTVG